MMKPVCAAAALLIIFAGMGAASAQEAAIVQEVKDATITARVETLLLLNDQLNPLKINTSTRNNVVLLQGRVDDPVEKKLAGDLAASVRGVQEVDNQLEVTPGDLDASEKPEAEAREAFRRRVDDANAEAAVQSRLLSRTDLNSAFIDVDAEDAAVTLSGRVETEQEKALAERIAKGTRGVSNVKNELLVDELDGSDTEVEAEGNGIWSNISDELVEKRIEKNLILSKHVSLSNLDVEMDNGVCVLTGVVLSEDQKAAAGDIAENTRGVDRVNNEIEVIE